MEEIPSLFSLKEYAAEWTPAQVTSTFSRRSCA
jgi:hypothetical protein